MTSTPAANSSSAIFGVIPRPPAAFSPLTTTNVGACSATSPGSRPSSVRRPRPPTRSPTKRMVGRASMSTRILSPMVSGERPPVPPVVVPRWVQLVMLPVGILALWALARAAGTVLLVFAVAAVLALILNPIVAWFQRRLRFPRGLAVVAVYLGLFVAVTG